MCVCVCMFLFLSFVLSLLSEIGASAFRNAEVPKISVSDTQSSEVPIFGLSNAEVPNIDISDLRSRQTKESVYIKASEFQSSSVYYWSSLEKDLTTIYSIKIATYYTTSNLVLSYKEHVQTLVAFNTHKL